MKYLEKKMKRYKERLITFLQKIYMVFLPSQARENYRAKIRENAFNTIMHEGRWGKVNFSGGGSTFDYTECTREIIEKVIRDYSLESMLDAASGDFVWMPEVLKRLPDDFRYIGCDIVENLITDHKSNYPQYEFRVLDFVHHDLPQCDLIFCRDALQHLPVEDIKKALENFSNSGARYLLATTHLRQFGLRNARNIRHGRCRDRNLLLKPFNLADPIAIFSERDPGHKFLGLWELPLKYNDM